jgi:glutamate decarboxylase
MTVSNTPVTRDATHLTPAAAPAHCDENTIGVVAVLGSTFDGTYEPVAGIAGALDELASTSEIDVPIHVDGASGGFVAPFLAPELEWDFRIPRVQSINASGHKFGLVYPGVGWAVWRDHQALPEELVFNVNYLGGNMPTFALNFSRPGSEVVAQYFMFTSLGREGYRRVIQGAQDVAVQVSSAIGEMGPYELLSEGRELPVFAFRLREEVENYTVFDVSDRLRQNGWLVPAYTFPENLQDMAVLRIVVRSGMTAEMGDWLIEHLRDQTDFLESLERPMPGQKRQAFAHT